MKTENNTKAAPAVIRLPYAGPDVMNAAPPRKPRKAAPVDGESAPAPVGNGGADFAALDFAAQDSIIRASVCNAFKMIENQSGKAFFEMENAHGDDARQETFCLCLERAENEKYCFLPLALYVAKAAATACNRLVYQSSKSAESMDADNRAPGMAERIDGPERAAENADFLPRALDLIPDDMTRTNAARLAALMGAGYTIKESAAIIGIGEKTAQRTIKALQSAAAIVRAIDGESAALELAIESDERTKSQLDRRARAAITAAARHDVGPAAAAGAVAWVEKRPAAVLDMARLTYVERIAYAAANQASLRDLFKMK